MIILMRGLPGSGKSTLARALAGPLNAVVLDKDEVRAALFPGLTVEYSTEQDDFVIGLMLEAAREHLQRGRVVFIDGRVNGRRTQVEMVKNFAERLETTFVVVECVCSEATALERIESDMRSGVHPAKNRDAWLLREQIARWEEIEEAPLRINTEKPLEHCLHRALEALASKEVC